MNIFAKISTIFFLLLIVNLSQADTLVIERMKKSSKINKPTKGQLKLEVRNTFGEPLKITNAIGNPPISIWHYPHFKVYFEHSHVIHSVINKGSRLEKGPKKINHR